MDKEVKIRLPKGKKVELINTSVKGNDIVVKYELADEFVPKRGDIIFTEGIGSKEPCISIFERCECGRIFTYIDYYTESNKFYDTDMSEWYFRTIDEICTLRLATEEETAKLYSVLREKGLVWNEETKSIEKYRRRANGDETYWFVDGCGVVQEETDCYFQSDDELFNLGNYFDTEEKAKKYADKIKELFKSNV